MEVGPNRWARSSHDFDTGVSEMKELAPHFKDSYILLRGPGVGHSKTCPVSLGDDLADKTPRIVLDEIHMHRVQSDEWNDLMKKMETKGYDCNFFLPQLT